MEFNNSNQAIVVFGSNQQTPDSIKSYYYKASDDKTIEIKNFGKMSVSSINEDSIRFSFLPVSGASVSLSGKKIRNLRCNNKQQFSALPNLENGPLG